MQHFFVQAQSLQVNSVFSLSCASTIHSHRGIHFRGEGKVIAAPWYATCNIIRAVRHYLRMRIVIREQPVRCLKSESRSLRRPPNRASCGLLLFQFPAISKTISAHVSFKCFPSLVQLVNHNTSQLDNSVLVVNLGIHSWLQF